MTDADHTLPTLISPHNRALPLLTLTDLRIAESQAAAALPKHTLMGRAGKSAASFLLEQITRDTSIERKRQKVWLIAGPGNNGGDALILATELHQAGIALELCMPLDVKPDDARWALETARAAGVPITAALPASLDAYTWLVDGMFGIGLTRPLEGVFAAIARRLSQRAMARPRQGGVLALDIPSGLDSDTGTIVGNGEGGAVHATHTITFIGAKPGLFTAQGRDLAGAVTVAPIGVDTASRTAVQLNAPELFADFLPPRDFATNKGSFGSLAVVGGDTGMCGAPILAARAALFSGAGKVHVALLGAGAPPYDPPHPELMLHDIGELPLDRMDALAIGCGMGQRERASHVMRDVLQLDVPKLFDADALNLIATDPALATAVTARGVQGDPCILTPHPLEAARLAGTDAPGVQRDRLTAARALAARFASVVVLKGSGTIIAAPDGRLAVNPTGNAALATGGTGDVLGGIIGALLAQRLPRYEAALAGVYLHGLAADTLSAQGHGLAGLTAGELAPMVRTLLNRLFYPA
ncbi:bifunctional ADP-dependent NAD(P)H-hydrate dehydratase/NAD(P)H-hydrate epimerase [Paraburkholderia ginsengiterrae]|uniref:Bifunctional NAD(P)H-hydrate repair enzyme n=1 Tax=Paraburkholderia ginsengiterrae TaxID=1462993 RepID=A0A1A9MZ77_9BURK|nr:bifunctional ADP-dependent NAD(P)H-hydrate dehydratase/NAD(P)H-hydrate epimerase [Paraburkholderia ginsengiterrae]OAJ53343.1 bifunctional ADP-dependent (S)-NAD(P)H-hydrate dehydratase/NAD(P)H-hydrate epimerase [Paraburkholderia ginsengiterrae]